AEAGVGKANVLHFGAHFQAFVGEQDREHEALRKSNLAAAVAADFLFAKNIGSPLHLVAEILGEEQWHFDRVGQRPMLLEKRAAFAFRRHLRRSFIMEDVADAELVFHEESRVERDCVPIRQGITAFDADRAFLGGPAMIFDRVFKRQAEPARQTDLDFLRKHVIWPIELEGVALINEPGEDGPRRQHISLGEIRKTAPGEVGRSAIGTRHFFTGDDKTLALNSLPRERLSERHKAEKSQRRDYSSRRLRERKICPSAKTRSI